MPVLAVEQFVRQNGISENTLLPGAFAYALGKYTGGEQKPVLHGEQRAARG